MIGRTLSHFHLTAKLGEGGMGEVYRAEDQLLGREVAIKILPAAFARNPERLHRFEREARVLASLNHPRIASIHEVREADGVHFLVMELVEGETLAERIGRGPLSVEETVHVARQIAEGLEAAHERGIIHRDLKPSNIKVAPDGRVKILDFGLAKASGETAPSTPDLSRSPTMTAEMTEAGVVLGTAAYMSPEQARGELVDRQTDIWALGCLLFEMLSGRRAFPGNNFAEISAAILGEEPAWDSLPSETLASLLTLTRRCLAKEKVKRLRHAGDAWLDLDPDQQAVAENGVPTRRPWLSLLAAAAVGAMLATAAPLVLRDDVRSKRGQSDLTLSLTPPQGHYIAGGQSQLQSFAVSPGGSRIAYVARDSDERTSMWIHDITSGQRVPLGGTEGAYYPFWAPNEESIGFFRRDGNESGNRAGSLWRLDLDSGRVAMICSLAPIGLGFRGGAWSAEDQILIGAGWDAMYGVSASGGTPEQITELDPLDNGHRWPEWLPDGRHFLFSVFSYEPERAGLYVGSVERGAIARVSPDYTSARWVEPGLILHVHDGNLVARAFDPERHELEEETMLVVSGVQQTRYGRGVFSVGGDLLAFGTGSAGQQLTWTDRSGRVLGTLGPPGDYHDLAISPDGSMAIAARVDQDDDLWLFDVERDVSRPVVKTPKIWETHPVWSPDQRSVAFSVITAEEGEPSTYRLDLASPAERTLIAEGFSTHDWSADGENLVIGDTSSLLFVGIDGNRVQRTLLDGGDTLGTYNFRARLSPDGRWLAYATSETGSPQVYVMDLNDRLIRRVSTDPGGSRPEWGPEGREILYLGRDGTLMSAAFDPLSGTVPRKPEALFVVTGNIYAVAPDGERILAVQVDPELVSPPVTVVTNWRRLLD